MKVRIAAVIAALTIGLAFTATASATNTLAYGSGPCHVGANFYGTGGGGYAGAGYNGCPWTQWMQLQTCIQYLVTGGWQNYFCWTSTGQYTSYISHSTMTFYPGNWSNRWWREQTWGYASGSTAIVYSDSYYL